MATDILTQLQTCYDQLLTQFFSTVSYLSQRHPLIAPDPIPGDPYTNPPGDANQSLNPSDLATRYRYTQLAPGPEDSSRSAYPLRPVTPRKFHQSQQELAEDLVMKCQQIEYLIAHLPGLGRGEDEQAEEIQRLVERVKEMEELRRRKREEMRQCAARLDEVIMGMATSIESEPEAKTNGNS